MMESAGEKTKNLKPFWLGLAALILLLLGAGIGGTVWATRRLSERPAVLALARIMNLSAARVNQTKISYTRYIEDIQVLQTFYAAQGDAVPSFAKEDISSQVLSRLIINALIDDLAKQLNVAVNDSEVAQGLANLVGPFASEEQIKQELQDRYGWSKEDYISKVVRPLLLEQKTAEAFGQSTDEKWSRYAAGEQVRARHILFKVEDEKEDKTIKKQAQTVLKRTQTGEDFAALALEFSADPSKDNGGDLGWFPRGVMVKEFEEAVFALEPGAVGKELVKSQFGYHIVKLEERRPFRDLGAWLDEQIRTAKIDIFISAPNPFAQIQSDAPTPDQESLGGTGTSTAESDEE